MAAKGSEISVTFRLDEDHREMIDEIAKEFDWSRAQVVRRLVIRSIAECAPMYHAGKFSAIMDSLRHLRRR